MDVCVDERGGDESAVELHRLVRRPLGHVAYPGDDLVAHQKRGRVRRPEHPAAAIERARHRWSAPRRASKSSRTAGTVRMRSSARSAWPGVYPFPTSIVTADASPSAPSAAAVKEVAIEKKMTVPWSGSVARIAPCSQPGTSTQTTVTSAGPPSAWVTASERATGSRASATATTSARPLEVS